MHLIRRVLLCHIESIGHYLLGFLLELLNGTLVNTTAFVDQMTGSGRLARVDVSDNDDIDVYLFLAHFGRFRRVPLVF